MKPKISAIILLILVLVWKQADADPAGDLNRLRLVVGDNYFAFNLFKQLAKYQPDSNIFISPYSAATVLQMDGNGPPDKRKSKCKRFWERWVCRLTP